MVMKLATNIFFFHQKFFYIVNGKFELALVPVLCSKCLWLMVYFVSFNVNCNIHWKIPESSGKSLHGISHLQRNVRLFYCLVHGKWDTSRITEMTRRSPAILLTPVAAEKLISIIAII